MEPDSHTKSGRESGSRFSFGSLALRDYISCAAAGRSSCDRNQEIGFKKHGLVWCSESGWPLSANNVITCLELLLNC